MVPRLHRWSEPQTTVPADYLNPSEKRELAEISSDLASLRATRKELNARQARIRARGVHRMEAARVATGARS
jgi:hypothetical protein